MTQIDILRAAREICAVNVERRRMSIVISTYDLDDADRRIDQSGWDFTKFAKNPVILWAHDDRGFTGSNGIPVAKGIVESIRVEGQKTTMEIEFPPPGIFPLADIIFELARLGFINSLSVGWNPLQVEQAEENGRQIRIFRRQELLEVSIVTLPSNSNALIERASARKCDAVEVKKLTEQLEDGLKSQTEEQAAAEQVKQYKPSHLLACVGYFDRKQPANKASTKFLKQFYETAMKAEPPADEVAAWEGMSAHVTKLTEPLRGEIADLRTELDSARKELAAKETKPKTEPAAAPQGERTASVRLSLGDLRGLAPGLAKALTEAAAEALRQGVPVKDIPGVLDAAGQKYKATLSLFRPQNHGT